MLKKMEYDKIIKRRKEMSLKKEFPILEWDENRISIFRDMFKNKMSG